MDPSKCVVHFYQDIDPMEVRADSSIRHEVPGMVCTIHLIYPKPFFSIGSRDLVDVQKVLVGNKELTWS